MRIGKQWLEQLYFRQLKKQLQQNTHKRKSIVYQQTKTIGILYDASNLENTEIVKNFINSHTQKVTVLAFFNDKNEHPDFLFDHFGKKSVSLTSIPKGEAVTQFIETPFDVLFDLNLEKNLMLGYIAALSKAHFKVGVYQELYDFYDLMIDMPKDRGINYFIQQAETLLENIKSEQHEVSTV